MVEGLVEVMDCDDFTGPVNLGNPREFSIKQLAELVVELTQPKSEIVYKPLPQDDPLQRCPDITLAKERLKWEPEVPLREGLEKTIEYFRQVL
jgi:UDP-glucuronate decarboxylase